MFPNHNVLVEEKKIELFHKRENIKHVQRSKTDLSKETIKMQRCWVKKVSLKILPPVYLHIIEIDIR